LIPDDVVEEIRDRADVVALIGEHVQLRKAGVNHKGLCPFHQEKTPSFHVNPQRRSFYCFGCQKKGDVFAFLMEIQGKGFVEVVRDVAERVGVVIPERPATPEEQARRGERTRLSRSTRSRRPITGRRWRTSGRARRAAPTSPGAESAMRSRRPSSSASRPTHGTAWSLTSSRGASASSRRSSSGSSRHASKGAPSAGPMTASATG
jgi:hypothetical protein